jgi:LysM repeat protein
MKVFKYLVILPLLFSSIIPVSKVSAIEYGGVGGKPANPSPNNERTKSIFIYTLSPNQIAEDELLVINNTAETKTLMIYATDSQRGSDGSFACEQYLDPKDNVGTWVKMSQEEVTLKSQTNIKIPFKVTAPENIDVGESNGCIMIQEKKAAPSADASGVSLSFRTGIRLVVTAPGEQVREVDIEEFTAHQEGSIIKAKIDIKNSGNVSIDTLVKIKTTFVLGTEYYTVENEYPILRAETATYNFEIPSPMFGGPYTISAELEYDKSSEASVGVPSGDPATTVKGETISIFITPTATGLIVEIIVLLILIALVYVLFKKYRLKRQIRNTWISYRPASGETINSIARKFNVDWNILAKANKLKPPYEIHEGTTIKVPSSK